MPVNKKNAKTTAETITVLEITRKNGAGRFTYAMYNGRTLRRAAKRGRPHYDTVGTLQLTTNEKPKSRDVNVNSQLGRLLLA